MKKLEIVKKNKQGKYFVNKGIQEESNKSLSWHDVLDLIDEALEYGVYPQEIVDELNDFADKILTDIAFEKEFFGITKTPPKPRKKRINKEPQKPLKPLGHTYAELEQNKQYKKETKKARSAVGKRRKEREKKSQELARKLKPKFLTTPMSKKSK